jgi:hypothetical protein
MIDTLIMISLVHSVYIKCVRVRLVYSHVDRHLRVHTWPLVWEDPKVEQNWVVKNAVVGTYQEHAADGRDQHLSVIEVIIPPLIQSPLVRISNQGCRP